MAESNSTKPSNKPASDHRNRRRALLTAMIGAGIPIAERVVPVKWATPVVDAVVLPAHADVSVLEFPLRFGSVVQASVDTNRSLFADVARRTEEEILNLFISTAEANTCDAAISCSADGPVTVDVVATIDGDPTTTACIEARVNFDESSSCATPKCEFFHFYATVSGETVTVNDNSCNLKLNNMTFNQAELNGDWSYQRAPFTEKTGQFTAQNDAGSGCGTLSCPEPF